MLALQAEAMLQIDTRPTRRDAEVKAAYDDLQHQQWLQHPWTRILLQELETQRGLLINEAERQSTSIGGDSSEIARIKLIAAKQIRTIIDYANSGKYPV